LPIRQHIDRVLSDPQSFEIAEQRLRQLVSQQGQSISEQQLRQFIAQLQAYVQGTPDLLDACAQAAAQAGVGHVVLPVLDIAGQYFLQPMDSIPDHFGLYGLLDDAYATQTLLIQISNVYAQSTGVPLLPFNLAGASMIVRGIIGEPIASQLDAAVVQTVQGALIQNNLAQLQVYGAGLPFADSYGTGGPGSWGGTWEDEMSRIGAECGISINW
jgi:uncharacterized membrane protein YkvA (DUF1232 family)